MDDITEKVSKLEVVDKASSEKAPSEDKVAPTEDKTDGAEKITTEDKVAPTQEKVASTEGKTASAEKITTEDKVSPTSNVSKESTVPKTRKTGIMFDECMLLHKKVDHPERPERLTCIMTKLKLDGLIERCVDVPSREATKEEILAVHTPRVREAVIQTQESKEGDIVHFRGGDSFANKYSSKAAHVAAGGLIELTDRVVKGTLDNGFAFIRPPGHHAEADEMMGFCLFNNVAIAAEHARHKLGVGKILIFDWDVHHGNGTQHIFEGRSDVMYCSVHKGGSFYPGTGKFYECGKGEGLGYTVNVPFLMGGMKDADYLASFKWVFMPIAKEFKPDLVIISAGFDCAEHDLLGPMKLSSDAFEQMLDQLMSLNSKTVCALEGGYEVSVTAKCVSACVNVLLGAQPSPIVSTKPSVYAWKDIKASMEVQQAHWPSIKTLLESEEWLQLCEEMKPLEKEIPNEVGKIQCPSQ